MAKQPIKRKQTEEFIPMSEKLNKLKEYKEKNNLVAGAKKKEQGWLILPNAFEEATGVVGIPLNTVSCAKGHTNTGKSSLVAEIIVACQKQNIIPIVFDLENAIKWYHFKEIGVEVTEGVDEETGEIIYGPGENMIYYDTKMLYEKYGKYDHSASKYVDKPTRSTYVIEDVALCIRETIQQQREEILPFDLLFIIDSIGCSDCYKSAVSNASNNMWFAGALSTSFQTILNDLIPSTANVNSKYNNTLFYVNKIWTATTPTGLPSAKEKGGMSFTYATRFSIFLGNQGGPGIKKQVLTYNKENYPYGNVVKIKIDKNHITNIEREGEICSTARGLCGISELNTYKEEFRKFLKEELSRKSGKDIKDSDLKEGEEIINE
jgi:hypothetical protein